MYQSGYYYYIPAGYVAQWTCTTTVTQDTTNTVTANFWYQTYDYYWGQWTYEYEELKAQATVVVEGSTGGDPAKCNIWYSSMGDYYYPGFLGTWDPETGDTTKVTIPSTYDSYYGVTYDDSSAMAVDPSNPDYVYYTKRDSYYGQSAYFMDVLWRYNATDGTHERVDDHQNRDGSPWRTNRLAVDGLGRVWSFDLAGNMWVYDPADGSTTNMGIPISPEGASINFANLNSGDITFDGLGNMWILASTGTGSGTARTFLITISRDELTDTSGINSTLVGEMDSPGGSDSYYNGIAFAEDGTLYASSTTTGSFESRLWTVNKIDGSSSMVQETYDIRRVGDLGSCAIPKPELRATKLANPEVGVEGKGQINYTITIENLGDLEATGVTFFDAIPSNSTYVPGSTKLNGEPVADVNGQAPFSISPGELVNGSLTSFAGVIPPDDKAVITFSVIAPDNLTEDLQVCNQGEISFTGGDVILTDNPLLPGGVDESCVVIYKPEIGIDKKADKETVAPGGEEVTYTYTVSTDPNQPKGLPEQLREPERHIGNEPLKNVVVSDDKCSPVKPVLLTGDNGEPVPGDINEGDFNRDGLLDPEEEWLYTCTQMITEETTNTAKATGVGETSEESVTDDDWWKVTPAKFAVEKNAATEGGWAPEGDPKLIDADGNVTLDYQVTVTNTGSVAFAHPEVTDTFTVPAGFTVTAVVLNETPLEFATNGNEVTFNLPAGDSALEPEAQAVYTIQITMNAEILGDVDWEAIGQCDTSAGGDPSKGSFNLVTMDGDSDGVENNDACIPVERPTVDITIEKIGENCDIDQPTCALPGAEFDIYDVDPMTVENAEPIASLTPTEEGGAVFAATGLFYDTDYWLVETKAPEGFMLLATPVQFSITEADGIVLADAEADANVALVASDNNLHLQIKDSTPAPLPATGGPGPWAYAYISMALMAGVALVRGRQVRRQFS